MAKLENIPANEAADIAKIAELTIQQLERRYAAKPPVLRGVHAKDHGCVHASFKVNEDLADNFRVGVFASPGREYEAFIRFSNASVSEDADSPFGPTGLRVHGSRGMAIKLLGVVGKPLMPTEGRLTQDFLLINQPVFAFANVEDYLALSQVLLKTDDPKAFFARTKDPDPEIAKRALRTLAIVQRVQSLAMDATQPSTTGAYQPPPGSPLGNQYFSAAPFLFGEGSAVKFSAKPVAPVVAESLDVADPRYLRTALRKRLFPAPDAKEVVFKFQIQIRTAKELTNKIDTEIEDATFEWQDPFVDVATITIPPQDFETAARRALCESLTFSPWHGLVEHRPLGGINRLRRPVYEASSQRRGAGGCPMSGIS